MNHSPVAGNSLVKDTRLLALALPIGKKTHKRPPLGPLRARLPTSAVVLEVRVAPERPAELMPLRSTPLFKHRDGQM